MSQDKGWIIIDGNVRTKWLHCEEVGHDEPECPLVKEEANLCHLVTRAKEVRNQRWLTVQTRPATHGLDARV